NLALIVLAAVFLGGCVMAYLAYAGAAASTLALEGIVRSESLLLRGHAFGPDEAPVALADENVKKAESDVVELVAHRELLRAAIAGNPEMAIKGKASANSAELSALLRESVDGWRKLAADQGIKLAPNEPTSFGFHRYIHNQGTSPKRDFQKVDQQRLIIDFLVRQLAESRQPGSPLLVESIDREPVETFVLIPEGKPGAGTYGPDSEASRNEVDEFTPSRTLARTGQVETLSFRVRFVAHTPTMRTFVNKIRNSGRPLAITAIDVAVASKETEKLLASPVSFVSGSATAPAPGPLSFFAEETPVAGAAKPATVEDKRVPVVMRKLSSFFVQVDYLSIAEEKPPVSAEGEPKK
ncbi:MAG: hypothetical protein ACKO8X_08840, partial [Verrucomicrobiota bacterium]